jgi:hypothetical protein
MRGPQESGGLPGRAHRVFLGLTDHRLSLYCIILFGVYLGSLYWVATFVATPDKSLTIGLLYRHDLQYTALIESLARLDFSPTYSQHFVGDGIVVFPILALLLHAILFKLLGAFGFLAADIFYTTAFFVAGYVLLRRFGIQSGLAVVAIMFNAFLVLPEQDFVTGDFSLPALLVNMDDFALLKVPIRTPRPLVSAPVFMVAILFLKYFWDSRNDKIINLKLCGFFALICAGLLQSNIYEFMGLSLPIGIVTGVLIATKSPENRGRAWLCVGWTLLLFMVFSIPFLIQIMLGSDSLGARVGIFDVVSLQDKLLIAEVFLVPHLSSELFYVNCGLIVILSILGRETREKAVFMGIVLFGYLISLFLYILSLPKQAQPYHYFRDELWLRVLVLVGVLLLVQFLIDRLRDRRFWNWLRILAWAAVSLVLLFAFIAFTDFTVHKVATRTAARWIKFPPAAPKHMRRDLAKVLTYLERRTAEGDHGEVPMLLSNDNMIVAWWAIKGKGTLLIPDVFNVTLTQAVIEQKLAQAGWVLGLDDETFVTLLSNEHFNNFFYGHNLYQASIIWHSAPVSDYPDEVRRYLMKRDKNVWVNFIAAWRTIVPLSHREYLRDFYKNYALEERLLPDYVVISRYKPFPRDLVLPENYRLTLKNRNYRVWIKVK